MTPERIASLLKQHVPGQTKKIAVSFIPPSAVTHADEVRMTEFDFNTEATTAEMLGPMVYEVAQFNCEERRQNSRYSITGFDSRNKETCYHVIFQRPERDAEAEEQLEDPSPTGILSQQMRLTERAYGQMTSHTKEILTQTRNVMQVQEQTIKAQGKRINQLEKERELMGEILQSLQSVSNELDDQKRSDQRWDRVFEIAETHLVPVLKDKILANPEMVKLLGNLSPDMLEAIRAVSAKENALTPGAAEGASVETAAGAAEQAAGGGAASPPAPTPTEGG